MIINSLTKFINTPKSPRENSIQHSKSLSFSFCITLFCLSMASATSDENQTEELVFDLPPFIRVFKNGQIERLNGLDAVPPSNDEQTGVHSKDIPISDDVSVRLYLPKLTEENRSSKLPILIYIHGGGFCIDTTSSRQYHNYLNKLVSLANVIAVSVNYRLAPEHPLPIAYDDSWAALKWVGSHSDQTGPEPWLNDYADLDRIFLAGDSAGANISHHMAIRYSEKGHELNGAKLEGIVLVQPYFWGKEPVGNETVAPEIRLYMENLWLMVCPGTSGCDDGWINPAKDGGSLVRLGCKRVLICVAEKDLLRDRDWEYYEKLKKSGWDGEVDILEATGELHVFHLFPPNTDNENAIAMLNRIVAFIGGN